VPRIALIYHDCLTRQVLTLWLRAAGYEVDLVPSDDLGGLLAEELPPDLVLVEYDLPDGSGPELLADLRSVRRLEGIPILALSACRPANGEASDGALANAWLAKPCDIGELSVWLVRLLGSPLAPYTAR
jgi:DNA-binding response OmpR family regulator